MTFRQLFLHRLGVNALYLMPIVAWLVGNAIGYALLPHGGVWTFQTLQGR